MNDDGDILPQIDDMIVQATKERSHYYTAAVFKAARSEIVALRTQVELAAALVKQLDLVHAHPNYHSVWSVSQLHIGPYVGPKYEDELKALKDSLSRHQQAPNAT